jgi:hypothetical protein
MYFNGSIVLKIAVTDFFIMIYGWAQTNLVLRLNNFFFLEIVSNRAQLNLGLP